MSWSVQFAGKKSAVLANVDKQFDQHKCSEGFPIEQKIKDACKEIVRSAAEGSDDKKILQISASGSASRDWNGNEYGPETSQNVKIEITQVYCLLE